MRPYLTGLIFVALLLIAPFASRAQSPPRALSSSDILKRIERLSVLGSVLYVAAHPDDENTAFLATMVNGYEVRAAYLSLTSGEGGQNLIGSEQGKLLGFIRREELRSARRIDGAEQFFDHALDFGYSKSTRETFEFWDKEKVLADLVYYVRRFRPDVMVTRFTPDRGGHGNHTASASLALDAFEAAGDPNRFPEQLGSVGVWKPVRIVWNAFRFGQTDPSESRQTAVMLDLGMYDPVLGLSYTELAGQARSMHKSQGFGASQFRGSYVNSFVHLRGRPATTSLFEGIDLTWHRVPGGESVLPVLDSLRRDFSPQTPAKSLPLLFRAREIMRGLGDNPDVNRKISEVDDIVIACAGLWIDALSDRRSYAWGDSLLAVLEVVNRSDVPVVIRRWGITGTMTRESGTADTFSGNERFTDRMSISIPAPASAGFAGSSEDGTLYFVNVTIQTPYGSIDVTRPVRFRFVDPVGGEKYVPIRILPAVTAAFAEDVLVFPSVSAKEVKVNVTSHTDVKHASLRLVASPGWTVGPQTVDLGALARDEQRSISVTISRGPDAVSGAVGLDGTADTQEILYSLREANYSHIYPVWYLEEAAAKVIATDVQVPPGRVGYIMGAGDEIPDGLRQIGLDIRLLDDDDLLNGDLSAYAVIVCGVRAYNTRGALGGIESRLRAYMEAGGVFIVQYVTTRGNSGMTIGPYPLTLGRDRVTDENAVMTLLQPGHPVFNTPNKITDADFAGWVQERGLYFASEWDQRYLALISCSDPGEEPTRGSLLIADVGKGAFIYTGLSFFRQIPAGVPGAYRLLVNLLSYRTAR